MSRLADRTGADPPPGQRLRGQPRGGRIDRGGEFRVAAGHRKLRELRGDRLWRVDEEPCVRGTEHRGVVVRVARGHHLVVQAAKRVHRGTLLVGHPEPVVAHPALAVDFEPVAEQRRPSELAHERVGEFVEGVGQDEDLVPRSQVVEELASPRQRAHVADHALDVGELHAVAIEQFEPEAHQLVVVGLVARRAREFGDPAAFGELDPDLGNEHSFHVEADDLQVNLRAGVL